MSKARSFIDHIDEIFGFHSASPLDASLHRATHSLVHKDAKEKAAAHAEKFRTTLQDKGLSKSHIKAIVSRVKSDAYRKHYRNTYTNTRRALEKHATHQE
jgi:hypothetical protein